MQYIQHLTTQNTVLVAGPATLTAPAVSAVLDTMATNLYGPINFVIAVGAVTAANATTVTVTESSAAAGPFVQGDNPTFTIGTANANGLVIVQSYQSKREFIQLSYGTPSGTSPSTAILSIIAVGQTKAASNSPVAAVFAPNV